MTADTRPLPEDHEEPGDHEQPISELFRVTARQWADADGAARLLEDMKTTTLEQIKSALIKDEPSLTEAKAERLARTSAGWIKYVETTCAARTRANRLRQKLVWLQMRHREWIGMNADERQERRFVEAHP